MPTVSNDSKSHVELWFDHLDLRNAIVPLMIPSVYVMPTLASHKKGMLHLVSVISTNETKRQYYVLLALVSTASHDPKSDVKPWFNCLHLMHKIVPLMIPLASHDTNAGANDIT